MKKQGIFCGMLLFAVILLLASAQAEVYTIFYHEGFGEPAEEVTTEVEFGIPKPTLTIEELEYEEIGRIFIGWAVHRDIDNKWYLKTTNDLDRAWMELADSELPNGYTYVLYGNNNSVSETAESGRVDFYAQWKEAGFRVFYHETEEAEASEIYTDVVYGEETATLTIESLYEQDSVFQNTDRAFNGWKVFREDNQTWRLVNSTGAEEWKALENGKLPVGYEYALWGNGRKVARTMETGGLHFFATWSGATFDVTDVMFGADGTDEADDREAIQKALNMAKTVSGMITVQVPDGTYYLGSALTIYSNTQLVLSSKAIIRRMNDSNLMLVNGSITGSNEGGYNRSKNLTITGGIWDGNSDGSHYANMFYLFHAENVTISGITMKKCCGNHFIELAAVKKATITGCSFNDYIPYSISNESSTSEISRTSEAIQLDFAGANSSSGAVPSDNTECQNITVTNCTFSNCLSGIGNHHAGEAGSRHHTDYTFNNNTFTNIHHTCINLYAVDNADIENNTANNVNRFMCVVSNNGNTIISKNIITEGNVTTQATTSEGSCIEINASQGIHIFDNEMDGFENSILVLNATAEIVNNSISNSLQAGICLENGSSGSITENSIINCSTHGINVIGSDQVTVSDNAVGKIIKHGIKIDNSDDAVLSGNNISSAGQYGITIITSNNFIADGNTIDTIGKSGIGIGNSSGNTVNNIITNCEEYNIFSYGTNSGIIENNSYDLGYGIVANGGLIRGTNKYLYLDHEPTGYILHYHKSKNTGEITTVTEVPYEEPTRVPTAKELNVYAPGGKFTGWIVYRVDTKTWRVLDSEGNRSWSSTVPEGGDYVLYVDGFQATKLVPTGVDVHLYAQWGKADPASLDLPADLVDIQSEAFMNNNIITEIILGDKVESIGSKAFASMGTLEYITIPATVITIADDAFEGSEPTIRCSQDSYAYQFAISHDMNVDETDH